MAKRAKARRLPKAAAARTLVVIPFEGLGGVPLALPVPSPDHHIGRMQRCDRADANREGTGKASGTPITPDANGITTGPSIEVVKKIGGLARRRGRPKAIGPIGHFGPIRLQADDPIASMIFWTS